MTEIDTDFTDRYTSSSVLRSSAEQAEYWVICSDRGLSEEETTQFQTWLDQSQSNREAYQTASALWLFSGFAAQSHASGQTAAATALNSSFSRRPSFWLGTLLSALLICGLGWQILLPSSQNRLVTGPQKVTYTLPDGSIAKLDAGSNAVLDYAESTRTVHLSSGAIFVDVRANKKRPFRIQLNDLTVEAVGTAYSVEQLAEGSEVVVHEGIVSLRSSRFDPSPIILKAGQKWRWKASDKTGVVTSGISNSQAYWNKGRIIAENTSLSDILEKMSRYQGEDILWIDPDISQILVSGLFQLTRSAPLSAIFLKRYSIEKYTVFGDQVFFRKKN